MENLSIVALYGTSSRDACGYCKAAAGVKSGHSVTFGMLAKQLTCRDYQALIDRGWRRSGTYLYKPKLSESCCSQFTIRLDATLFELSKGQRKVVRKMHHETHSRDETPQEKPSKTRMDTDDEDALATLIRDAESGKERRLRTELVPARFERDTFELYRKYQRAIHGDSDDKLTEAQYTRFLVDSPLKKLSDTITVGSFHQKYYMDETTLVAVGFIDVLPRCVSSVYFVYDPDCARLSLGVYSALREIMLTREYARADPDLRFYYMGYYIHDCAKMRYKAQYRPSELLCPRTFRWARLAECEKVFSAVGAGEVGKVAFFEGDSHEDAGERARSVKNVPCMVGNRVVRFEAFGVPEDDELYAVMAEYAEMAGAELARRMVVQLG